MNDFGFKLTYEFDYTCLDVFRVTILELRFKFKYLIFESKGSRPISPMTPQTARHLCQVSSKNGDCRGATTTPSTKEGKNGFFIKKLKINRTDIITVPPKSWFPHKQYYIFLCSHYRLFWNKQRLWFCLLASLPDPIQTLQSFDIYPI